MALLIGDNFNYQGQKPNFERDSFDTLESMISYPETSIDDGHISYCKETGKHYIFNSSNESTDTGKWREFSAGVLKKLSEASEAFNTIYMSAQRGTSGTIDDYSNLISQLTEDFYLYCTSNQRGYRIIFFTKDDYNSSYLRIEDFEAQPSFRTTDKALWLIDIDSTGNYTRISTGVTGGYITSNRANRLVFSREDSTSNMIDLLDGGLGNKYLSDDGTYKEIDTNETYVIDYLPEPSGTVTQEQYNELRQAIDNNYNIIFKTGLTLYPLMAQNNDSYIILSFFNDSSFGSGIHNIWIEEDLTYSTRLVGISAFYLLQFSSELDTGNITQTQYNDLKAAVNNSYTIAIRRGVGGELQFCTTTFYASNSEIYLQSADHHRFTYITITPDLTYTIENDTAPWGISGTEGQVYTYTSNGGLWKDIPNASGPIKDFNDAPEVVKNTFGAIVDGGDSIQNYDELAEAVGTTIVTYLYNQCGNIPNSTTFENIYITVAPYNGGILYTVFAPVNPGSYFMNSHGYIFITSAGIIEYNTHGLLTRAISDGISIDTVDYISSLSRNITLKTEGTGNQFLADNGQYVEMDASGSSAILPFEKAPEAVQRFINDYLQDIDRTSYTIDYADQLLTANDFRQTYLFLSDDYGVVSIYYNSTNLVAGAFLDAPFYGGFHLQAALSVSNTGTVSAQYMSNMIYQNSDDVSIGITVSGNDYQNSIDLKTNGDGTKYLGDDGEYHEVQQVSSYGTTANRPSNVSIGFQYFDTDLNRPIWWNGTEWVGATDANIVKLTQAQYEALPTKDPDTIYFIKG